MSDLIFNGERAFKDLKKLALEIGPRPAGSKAEERAVEYIKGEFEAFGLKTEVQQFEFDSGRITSKKLEVIEPFQEEFTCEAMALMGETPPKGVEGDLIYIDSTDEEYLTPEITGKIVVTPGFKTKNLPLISKVRPLGFIRVEAYPGVQPKHLWGDKERWEKYGNYPTVRISNEDGVKLISSDVRRVRLIVESEIMKLKSMNVIAELEGSTKPDEIVLIGGHYDTVPNVQGASDNAGGIALVLELARVFKEKGTKRTMRFIAWGNEEMGLIGSRRYARNLKEADKDASDDDHESELKRIKLALNLDVHGSLIGKNAASVLGPPELTTSIKLLASEVGTVYEVKEDVYSSDGTPISSIGIPSVSFSRRAGSDILMHSVEDTVKWLNSQALQKQGEFIELFLKRYVAKAAAFPFKRNVPEKLQEKVEEYFKDRLRTPP